MPSGLTGARRTRWIATVGDGRDEESEGGLDPRLALSLAGISIRIPPLRERPAAIEPFAADTAVAWCTIHGEQPRQFSPAALEALRDYPWPGNLSELEAVVTRTLAAGLSDPIEVAELCFDEAEELAEGVRRAEEREADEEEVERRPPEVLRVEAPAAERPPEEPEPAPQAATAPPATPSHDLFQRLLNSFAHQVRNPLVAIRTFASLIPERFDDPEFRGRFHEVVASDLGRIERILDQLAGFAALKPVQTAPVDVAALIEELLEERRGQIQARRLLVLKEIDSTSPLALCDEAQLRFALGALLDRAFEWVPEQADLYLASKHHPTGLRGGPAVRVLIRFHNPLAARGAEGADAASEDISLRYASIEIVLAELVIGSQAGTLTVDTTDAEETVILLDLPAPA
jgi:signal transduction histidine kinase